MYSRTIRCIPLLAALAMTLSVSAQDNPKPPAKHHQYKLYDVGTFGGPSSYTSFGVIGITPAGTIGAADTPLSDPYSPNCYNSPDCFLKHAFQWKDGVLTDLGALPGNNGGNSSYSFAINNGGFVAGISENGSIDPATGYPESVAVVWQNGNIRNLGTFGGTQSSAEVVNDHGQVVGVATNAIPDPFSFGGGVFPATTQARAFLWDRGVMRDLGTLGGPDAYGRYINQSGQVAGWSYTSNTPNPDTGIPTVDPFFWSSGRMIDVGGLGGDYGQATGMNNRGQVVGFSNVAGDQSYHGFLWDRGVLTDLGTFGGNYSSAEWINDAGDISGESTLPGDTVVPGALWSHGKMTNLGILPGDNLSNAKSINSRQQIVGFSCLLPCDDQTMWRAFLWENGGPMVELDALVENLSDFHVYWGTYIGENGTIVAQATLPNGDVHDVVLVPHGNCDGDCEQRLADSQNKAPVMQSAATGAMPAFGRPADWLRNPSGSRMALHGYPGLRSNH